jgi:hypothetical protein
MSIVKIESLKGTQVNLKIHETFGTVRGKLLGISGETAKITFVSFGSAYTMVVPTQWIFTKNTEGKSIDLKAGVEVTANIEAADVWARKVTLLDLNSVGVLVEAGNRTRFFTWDRVKSLDVPREVEAGAKKSNFGRVAKAVAPAAKPAGKPALKVAARPAAPKAPARRAA